MWRIPEGPTRDRLEYLWDDFRSRPDRVKLAARLGGVLGGFLLLLIVLLLTRGHPKPQKVARTKAEPPTPAAAPVIADAFGFAQSLGSRLRSDGRFSRVYLVPTAADPAQKFGKVVVMGDVASDADLRALQTEAIRGGVPIPLEWQVVVNGPATR
jgi:hypothetical protein